MRTCAWVALALAFLGLAAGGQARWKRGAPVPVPRSEVAAALVGGRVVVAGGFLQNGFNSTRVDAYDPARDRWVRLPDLPVRVDHAMAAGYRGRLYVLGGYGADRARLRTAFVLERGRWRRLPPMPLPRAAAGAAIAGGRLYVVGGVGLNGLARAALSFDLTTRRWRTIAGPTPREHLGVTALGGRVYAVGGRTAGFDTNLDLVEAWDPARRTWLRRAPVPGTRGGTAAAAVPGAVVSAGGEETAGSISTVFAYNPRANRWRRLPDLPTPRHGLGLVGRGGRVYAVAGGPVPGLSVSGANESLAVSR